MSSCASLLLGSLTNKVLAVLKIHLFDYSRQFRIGHLINNVV